MLMQIQTLYISFLGSNVSSLASSVKTCQPGEYHLTVYIYPSSIPPVNTIELFDIIWMASKARGSKSQVLHFGSNIAFSETLFFRFVTVYN